MQNHIRLFSTFSQRSTKTFSQQCEKKNQAKIFSQFFDMNLKCEKLVKTIPLLDLDQYSTNPQPLLLIL